MGSQRSHALVPAILAGVLALLVFFVFVDNAEWALPGLGVVLLLVSVLLFPEIHVFLVLAIMGNMFGLIDLQYEFQPDLRVSDCLLALTVIVAVIGSLWKRTQQPGLTGRRDYWVFIGVFYFLFALAVLYTSMKWSQDVWLSVKAAKPALFYSLVFVGAMLPVSRASFRRAHIAFTLAGLFTSTTSIVGFFVPLDEVLPGVATQSARGDISSIQFHRTYTPDYAIIYLAFFIALFDKGHLPKRLREITLAATGLAALFIGFRAFWLGMIVALLWVVAGREGLGRLRAATVRRLVFAAAVVAAVGIAFNAQSMVAQRLEVIPEDIGRPTGSLGFRLVIIHQLVKVWATSPWFGVGFLHSSVGIGATMAHEAGLREIGTIDVGWVDILVKLGVIGSLAFSALFVYLCKTLRAEIDLERQSFATAVRAYIVMSVVALPGAAVFTWTGGVAPMALALGLLAGPTIAEKLPQPDPQL